MKTFLVDELIMTLYRECADELGYIVHDTEYEDEWEVSHPDQADFSNTVSGRLLLSQYVYHNTSDISYCDEDERAVFSKLDAYLHDDAWSQELSTHMYLDTVNDIQSCLYNLRYPSDKAEVVAELIKEQSFVHLRQMYETMNPNS